MTILADLLLSDLISIGQWNNLLVSTHIVCERLSVMQDLAWVRKFCAQNPKNTLFLARTSLGGLSKFGSEVGQEYLPPPNKWKLLDLCAGSWCESCLEYHIGERDTTGPLCDQKSGVRGSDIRRQRESVELDTSTAKGRVQKCQSAGINNMAIAFTKAIE